MKNLVTICTVVVIMMAISSPSKASVQLLNVYSNASGAEVSLTDGTISGSDIPVTINFYAPNSFGDSSATGVFSFSATTSGTATLNFGFLYATAVTNLSFSIVDNTVSQNNIFSGTATYGTLIGTSGGFTLSGQNLTDNDGVTFSTPYFALGNPTDFSYQIALGAPNVGPSITDGTLDDFTAPLTPSTFSGSTVPEPATMALLGLGGLLLSRRKK